MRLRSGGLALIYTMNLEQIDRNDIADVGGKGAQLGELIADRRHSRARRLLRDDKRLSCGPSPKSR